MSPQFRIPVVDSTSRDYRSIRDTLINLIPYFTSEWTNFNASDPGITLLELQAAVSDNLHFYLDQIARDGGWSTAISRGAIISQAKLINYQLRGPSSAVVELIFTLPEALPTDVTIPAGTRVKTTTSPVVVFELDEDFVIPAGAYGDETDANGDYLYIAHGVEGETKTEITAPSDGTAYQQRILSSQRTVDGSFRVYVDEGGGPILWTETRTISRSEPTDKHYYVQRDEDDYITIFFGDNVNGKIPAASSSISVSYLELTADRGNIYGNVPLRALTLLDSTIYYGTSVIVPEVFNPSAASGGEPRETIAEAKKLGPASLAAMERAVTADDFIYFAEQFPGVARAGASPSEVCSELIITVVPEGGGTPSPVLLADLKAFLETKKMLGSILQMDSPDYITIELEGVVHVNSAYSLESVQADVQATVQNFFDSGSGSTAFGQTVQISDIYKIIREVEGVDYVELSRFTREPVATLRVWTGNATFGTITIGQSTIPEIWTVTFFSSTEFTVKGSVSGSQTNAGQLDQAYVSDKQEISFTIATGINPLRRGDYATIRVSNLVGSVVLDPTEFPELGSITGLTFEGGI